MKAELKDIKEAIDNINTCIDSLFVITTNMLEDYNRIAKASASQEDLFASCLQTTALAIDSQVRFAKEALDKVSEALDHPLKTDTQ